MKHVQGNLKIAQDRKKRHADLKRTPKELQVGEHVFVKVKPRKRSFTLGSSAKLAARCCRTFEILEKVGPVAY